MDRETSRKYAQNYRGYGGDTVWAEADTVLPEADLHIGGTIPRGKGLEFWLSRPRPNGVSVDEWDRLEQEKWDRIWRKG